MKNFSGSTVPAKSFLSLTGGFVVLGLVSACTISSTGNDPSQPIRPEGRQTLLSYQLSENGCDTGKHSFSSLADYCAGLEDSSLNQGCAQDMRQTKYQSDCVGKSGEVNTYDFSN